MAGSKSIDQITSKFVRNAGQAGTSYSEGVASPRRDWATAAKAAESNYDAGVTAAIGRKAFGKGVSRAGSQKQISMSIEKGAVRFGPGVAASAPAYQAGFGPYLSVINSTTLPQRYARRDPRNLQRVTAIATALGAAKEQKSKS